MAFATGMMLRWRIGQPAGTLVAAMPPAPPVLKTPWKIGPSTGSAGVVRPRGSDARGPALLLK